MPPEQTTLLFQVAAPGVRRRALRDFARRLSAEVANGDSFCCVVTDDRELRRLNRDFRRCDYATDVLSFPANGTGEQKPPTLGEIAISFDRAKAQAAEHGHDAEQEIRILMLHGLLHLLG